MNLFESGTFRDFRADGRDRTADKLITNQLLYQLSYIGEVCVSLSVSVSVVFGVGVWV